MFLIPWAGSDPMRMVILYGYMDPIIDIPLKRIQTVIIDSNKIHIGSIFLGGRNHCIKKMMIKSWKFQVWRFGKLKADGATTTTPKLSVAFS